MAFLLSVSFSLPLCYRQTLSQASYSRRLSGGKLLNPLTNRTVTKHVSSKYSGGSMISLNESHHCNIYHPPSRQCHEPNWCHGHVQISGFWMGPDIEDGWGFIQASVFVLTSLNPHE